jgi:hypothetical protein
MKEDLKPARETNVKIPNESNISSEETFAVCLETDDRQLLIPFKIYRIKLRGEYVRVIDEKGEVAVYPKNFFLPLQLPSETINVLSTAYSHIS